MTALLSETAFSPEKEKLQETSTLGFNREADLKEYQALDSFLKMAAHVLPLLERLELDELEKHIQAMRNGLEAYLAKAEEVFHEIQVQRKGGRGTAEDGIRSERESIEKKIELAELFLASSREEIVALVDEGKKTSLTRSEIRGRLENFFGAIQEPALVRIDPTAIDKWAERIQASIQQARAA